MEIVVLLLKILAATALAVLLLWRVLHYRREEHQGRETLLEPFTPRLEKPIPGKDALGYPTVRGSLDGGDLRLALFPDTLVLRTLPTLWLQATWSQPHGGRLRVTLNPSGGDYFTDPSGYTVRFAPPPSWELPAEICGAGSPSLQLLTRLDEVAPTAFPSLKEILVEEDFLRLTFRCARADRTTYRILRSARFEGGPLPVALVDEVLTALRTVEAALQDSEVIDEYETA